MQDGILQTIGNTPLVELRRLVAGRDIRLFGKLEGFNPGGIITAFFRMIDPVPGAHSSEHSCAHRAR